VPIGRAAVTLIAALQPAVTQPRARPLQAGRAAAAAAPQADAAKEGTPAETPAAVGEGLGVPEEAVEPAPAIRPSSAFDRLSAGMVRGVAGIHDSRGRAADARRSF
jgi:hypothetical protein